MNSSNSGVCPGSVQPCGLRMWATLTAGVLGVHAADVFVDELGFVAGGGDAGGLRDESGHSGIIRVDSGKKGFGSSGDKAPSHGRDRNGMTKEAAEKVTATKRNRRFLGAEAPRNDRNKGFTTAHLKARPFKTAAETTFQQRRLGTKSW